jgi:hypothetical protein
MLTPARGREGKACPEWSSGKESSKDRLVAAGELRMAAGGPGESRQSSQLPRAGAPPAQEGGAGGGTQSWWSKAKLKASGKRTAPLAITTAAAPATAKAREDTAAALAMTKARESRQCGERPEEGGSVGSLSPTGSLLSLSGASTPLGSLGSLLSGASTPLGSSGESTPWCAMSPLKRCTSVPGLGLGGGVDARVLLRLGDALCPMESMDKLLELSRGVQQEEARQLLEERQREVQHYYDPAETFEEDFAHLLDPPVDAPFPLTPFALTLKRSSEHIMQDEEEEEEENLFSFSAPPTKRSFAGAPSPEASSVVVESLYSAFVSTLRLDADEAGEQESAAGLLADLDFFMPLGGAAPTLPAHCNQPASSTRSQALDRMYFFL